MSEYSVKKLKWLILIVIIFQCIAIGINIYNKKFFNCIAIFFSMGSLVFSYFYSIKQKEKFDAKQVMDALSRKDY